MDRILFQPNTKIDLPQLFSDLQSYMYRETIERVGMWYQSYGVDVSVRPNGLVLPSDSSLKVYLDGSTVKVASGIGLTSDGYYICNSGISSVVHAGLGDGTHTLSVVYSGMQTDPTYIRNGFVYYETPGSPTILSREHKGVMFKWDLNPLHSGIALATVAVSGGTAGTITDLRQNSCLFLDVDIFGHQMLRTSEYGLQTLEGNLFLPQVSISGVGESNILSITPGVSGIQSFTGEDYLSQTVLMHEHNQDTGTTHDDFRVGVGSLGSTQQGWPILTIEDPPPTPAQFRIYDVEAETTIDGKGSTGNVKLKLAWNWGNITGAGSYVIEDHDDSTKRATQLNVKGLTVIENELNNFYVTSVKTAHGTGLVAHIFRNEATVDSVTKLYIDWFYGPALDVGVTFDEARDVYMESIIIDETCEGRIQCWADVYEILSIPVDNTGREILTESFTTIFSYGSEMVPSIKDKFDLALPIGQTFNIYIRAYWRKKYSGYAKLQAGTLTKSQKRVVTSIGKEEEKLLLYDPYPITYTVPYYVKLPTLNYKDVILDTKSTDSGFTAVINDFGLWNSATEFEFVYAKQAADFDNDKHAHTKKMGRTFDFVTSEAACTYTIKVRPLYGQQSLTAGWVEATVDAGFNGYLPGEKKLTAVRFNKRTFSGTVHQALTETIALHALDMRSPGAGATYYADVGFAEDVGGRMLVDTNTSAVYGIHNFAYYYPDKVTPEFYVYSSVKIQGTAASHGDAYTIDYAADTALCKQVRRLGTFIGTDGVDYRITNVSVDCDYLMGDSAVIRWYQEGNEDKGEYLVISAIDVGTTIFKTSNVMLTAKNGTCNLIVDLFDSRGAPINYSSCGGSVTIRGQALLR